MKPRTIKIIITLLLLVGAYFIGKKFPDEMILILGIALVIIIGNWMINADKEEYN